MEERAIGLIIRTRPLTESSLIIHWLSAEQGRVATVAKGARRPRSPFLGRLDLFYQADFSFARSRRGDLHTLREVSVREFNAPLRSEMSSLQQACYFAGLVEGLTETETPLDGLLVLMLGALAEVQRTPGRSLIVFAFETKLLDLLGLTPKLRESGLSAGSQQILMRCTGGSWMTLQRIHLSPSQHREIGPFLNECLIAQLGKTPPGREPALGRA